MATSKQLPQNKPVLEETPEVTVDVAPEVTPELVTVVQETPTTGPTITYVGEGADKVVFTVNPNALRYVVHASGLVVEDLA